MDNQTRELIENVTAIGVEYGVDIAGGIVLLVVGWTVAGCGPPQKKWSTFIVS